MALLIGVAGVFSDSSTAGGRWEKDIQYVYCAAP